MAELHDGDATRPPASDQNGDFDMQTKDTLTLRASAFGSKCELPEKFLKKVADAGVLEAVAQFAKYKEDRALKKSDGAKRNRLTGAFVWQASTAACRPPSHHLPGS